MSDPESYVTVTFRLFDQNYEYLYSTAAANGESMEVALNRATVLYEKLHRAEPGTVVGWEDREGNKRRAAVLPVKIKLPWYLNWLFDVQMIKEKA
jgi:hypothetical protein